MDVNEYLADLRAPAALREKGWRKPYVFASTLARAAHEVELLRVLRATIRESVA